MAAKRKRDDNDVVGLDHDQDNKDPKRKRVVVVYGGLFHGRQEGIVSLIWSFGTTKDCLLSWSRVNRGWRYYSRATSGQALMMARHARIDHLRQLESSKKRPLPAELDKERNLLWRWCNQPPCWTCGATSVKVMCVRMQEIRRGLSNRQPPEIASYCSEHGRELRRKLHGEHVKELADKWVEHVGEQRAQTARRANAHVLKVLESIPDASAALQRKLQQLVGQIIEDFGQVVKTDGLHHVLRCFDEINTQWQLS